MRSWFHFKLERLIKNYYMILLFYFLFFIQSAFSAFLVYLLYFQNQALTQRSVDLNILLKENSILKTKLMYIDLDLTKNNSLTTDFINFIDNNLPLIQGVALFLTVIIIVVIANNQSGCGGSSSSVDNKVFSMSADLSPRSEYILDSTYDELFNSNQVKSSSEKIGTSLPTVNIDMSKLEGCDFDSKSKNLIDAVSPEESTGWFSELQDMFTKIFFP